jgi:hypothetical protein
MNKILLPVGITVSLMMFSACSSSAGKNEATAGADDTKAQYEKTLKDAETVFKAVDQVGGGWAFTEDMMSDAKKAAASNDYGKALQLAKEAYDQSVMAKQQYDSQIKAGPTLF